MTELLPCPFCGREGFLTTASDWSVVSCIRMLCQGYQSMLTYANPESAVSAWNARATPADHSLPVAWKDAYAAFKGAFDTPQMRMKMNDEYSQDARKRLRNFDELMTQPPKNVTDTD